MYVHLFRMRTCLSVHWNISTFQLILFFISDHLYRHFLLTCPFSSSSSLCIRFSLPSFCLFSSSIILSSPLSTPHSSSFLLVSHLLFSSIHFTPHLPFLTFPPYPSSHPSSSSFILLFALSHSSTLFSSLLFSSPHFSSLPSSLLSSHHSSSLSIPPYLSSHLYSDLKKCWMHWPQWCRK